MKVRIVDTVSLVSRGALTIASHHEASGWQSIGQVGIMMAL